MEKKKKTYLLIGLSVVALSTGAAVWYFSSRNKPNNNQSDLDFLSETATNQITLPEPTTQSSSSDNKHKPKRKSSHSNFPLKKGSRGKIVKALQQFLIKKFGRKILPKWGADGIWGSELNNALKSKNLPTVITEEIFNRHVSKSVRSAFGLSGTRNLMKQLITTRKSRVWNRNGRSIIVAENTLLGEPINDTAGVTLFRTLDQKELFINTNSTNYV